MRGRKHVQTLLLHSFFYGEEAMVQRQEKVGIIQKAAKGLVFRACQFKTGFFTSRSKNGVVSSQENDIKSCC